MKHNREEIILDLPVVRLAVAFAGMPSCVSSLRQGNAARAVEAAGFLMKGGVLGS